MVRAAKYMVFALGLISASPVAAIVMPVEAVCNGIEADMSVSWPYMFGYDGSGYVIENYEDFVYVDGGGNTQRAERLPLFDGFVGVRITQCSTGRFIAINGPKPRDAEPGLVATEFLREKIRNQRPISFANLQSAAEALYDEVHVLRDTEETCGCNLHFPELKPSTIGSFEGRTDIE